MNNNENFKEVLEMLKDSLANGRQPLLTVTSNSMSPLIKKGDQILLSNTSTSQLSPGDIITIEKEKYLLTHRLYCISESGTLSTRGDRPQQFDSPTSIINLIGRVIAVKRKNKCLYLNKGLGKKLNDHIAWLASLEAKLLHKPASISSHQDKQSKWQIATRKTIYIWEQVLTTIVKTISSKRELS